MELSKEGASWGSILVLVAAALLIVARFANYIDIASDVDLDLIDTLAWWGIYLVGIFLVAIGGLGELSGEDGADDRAWMSLLFGLLILVVMPASPAPGAEFSQMLGGMFGP